MNHTAIQSTSIRSRAAFVLAVAESVYPLLEKNRSFFDLARMALDSAWQWVRGGNISGHTLYSFLENYDDNGLLIYEWESSGNQEIASIVITSAIAYVSWHAYRQAGQAIMPSSIQEVNEETIGQIVDFALKTSMCNSRLIDQIASYCLAKFIVDNPSELGERIDRIEFMKLSHEWRP